MQNILALALAMIILSGTIASVYMAETLRLTYSVLGNITVLVNYGENLLYNMTHGENTRFNWNGYNKYIGYAHTLNTTIIEMINNITTETYNLTSTNTGITNTVTPIIAIDYGNGTTIEYELINTTHKNGVTIFVLRPKS